MVGGVVEALWGAWQLLCGSSRHELFLITGNFNNPGPYSAYLVMAALTALVLLKTKSAQSSPSVNAVEKLKNMAALITASLCLAVLPATWSRAAFVSLAVCMLWIYRRKYWRYRCALWGILAIAAVTFYYFKQGSADGRMVIWQAALTSWLSSPWFGMGTGGFCHAFAEGMSGLSSAGNINMDSAGVTMYSYNSLVGILTEQGVVGLVICMLTVAIVLWKLYNASRSLFFAVLSLLIFSLFSYPFELLSYRILIVLAALASGERTVNTEQFINRSEKLRIKSIKK
jgi:O-antigen ligase